MQFRIWRRLLGTAGGPHVRKLKLHCVHLAQHLSDSRRQLRRLSLARMRVTPQLDLSTLALGHLDDSRPGVRCVTWLYFFAPALRRISAISVRWKISAYINGVAPAFAFAFGSAPALRRARTADGV